MTSKRAFTVWVLVALTFLAIIGLVHALASWFVGGVNFLTYTLPLIDYTFQIQIMTYFIICLAASLSLMGATCYAIFDSDLLELQMSQLTEDMESELEEKTLDIKTSMDQALTRLGLREFQLRESMKNLGKKLKKNAETQEKAVDVIKKKVTNVERKLDKAQTAQKDLLKLKAKLDKTVSIEKRLQDIEASLKALEVVPKPNLASTDQLRSLEGSLLRKRTIRRLESEGLSKVEDLLLKSPMEISLTKAMSESEARSLQSILQLLLVPGVKHEDAMLLLEAGVSSKEELALQDSLSLGGRLSKVAELYIEEGKIGKDEKPTLEEIASWVKWAKTR